VSKTVIAYYPGGGGHRYARYLQHHEFSTIGILYDNTIGNQPMKSRYLCANTDYDDLGDTILTHCLNANHIIDVLNPEKIIFIKSDFKQSLLREWVLAGNARYACRGLSGIGHALVGMYNGIKDISWPLCNSYETYLLLPERYRIEVENQLMYDPDIADVESAWSAITWHHDYYMTYPPFFGNNKFVDTADNNNFSNIMRAELATYTNTIFEFCWEVFMDSGKHSPIKDLFSENKTRLMQH